MSLASLSDLERVSVVPSQFGRALGLVPLYSSCFFPPVPQGIGIYHPSISVLFPPTAVCSIRGGGSLCYHVSLFLAVLFCYAEAVQTALSFQEKLPDK